MSATFPRDDWRRARAKSRRYVRRNAPRVRFGLGLNPRPDPAEVQASPAPYTAPAHLTLGEGA